MLLAGGAIAPLLFVPFLLIGGYRTPRYGHISSTFSDAASQGAPHPVYVTMGLIAVAICLSMAALGLARTLPARQVLTAACLIVSAAGILGTAIFRDYNRAAAVPRNREGFLHNSFAIVTILAIELTILVIWNAVQQDDAWRHMAMPALFSFVIVALSGIAFNFGPDSHDGLAERILAGTAFVFLSALCLTALSIMREEPLRFFPSPEMTAASPVVASLVLDE